MGCVNGNPGRIKAKIISDKKIITKKGFWDPEMRYTGSASRAGDYIMWTLQSINPGAVTRSGVHA